MRLLIIDCMNLYLRSYIVDPSLSLNGNPIGGLRGFLKTFQKICRETKPDKVVLAWDGAGGSKKRRSVDKNYKSGRKPLRLNREIRNLSESEEIYNKFWQQVQLIEYLNLMPVSQLMFDGIKGVGGAGLKTVSKRFPFLLEEDFCTIEQLIEFCSDIEKPLIIHKNIINNGDVIKKNYKMMQLSVPSLSAKTCMKINYILDNSELIYNRTELKKMMLFDGFGDWDHSDLDVTFNRLLFNQREIDRNKNL
jgi:5'-3' exonuclease